MPIVIDNVRLPAQVEKDAQYQIKTRTDKVTALGGGETRYKKRRPYVCATLVVGPDDAYEVMRLFRRQDGDRHAFDCRDFSDDYAEDELLEPDDEGAYPLRIDYGDDNRHSYRPIYLPILDDENVAFVVALDGVPIPESPVTYTVEISRTGPARIVPNSGEDWSGYEVTWTGLFDFVGRFDGDEAQITVLGGNEASGNRLKRVVVRVSEVFDDEDGD